MPSLGDHSPRNRSIDWPGIARTLLLQVLVLLALSGAVIRYLDWSSDAAWAEFSGAKNLPPSAAPLLAVKAKAPCDRKP